MRNDNTRAAIVGATLGLLANICYWTYKKFGFPNAPDYRKDFIAQGTDFNRLLTAEEKKDLSIFPNLKHSSVTFLGVGKVKPSEENCKYYECYFPQKISIYDKKTGAYKSTITSVSHDMDLAQLTWEKCHSPDYQCTYRGHFGATYNCIGWALGITKWLDPHEITSYIIQGKNRQDAINQFIKDKFAIFNNSHISNVDTIVDKLHAINSSLPKPIANNTVAFFFDNSNGCQHGARFLKTLDNKLVDKWTSKLGAYITISHDESDLIGSTSPYGVDMSYAII